MPAIVDCFRFFAGAVRCMHGAVAGEYLAGHTSMIRRDPIGVVGSIAPWNYPLMMAAWKLAPAFAGGNTVVFKPSEQTPLTALKLAKTIAEILPEGVVNVVIGRGATTGNALINHPKIAMISLTGGIATGKKVLQAASATLKRTHLELGGKAPVIVFDDADIAAVVDGLKPSATTTPARTAPPPAASMPARRSTTIWSPTCRAPSRAEIQSAQRRRERYRPADLHAPEGRVASFVERAAEQNHIEITTGGKSPGGKGFFFEPTVIAGAQQNDEIVRRRCSARSCR